MRTLINATVNNVARDLNGRMVVVGVDGLRVHDAPDTRMHTATAMPKRYLPGVKSHALPALSGGFERPEQQCSGTLESASCWHPGQSLGLSAPESIA